MRPQRNLFVALFLLLVAAFSSGCKCNPDGKPEDKLPAFNPRPGSLEFCIVANQVDDADVIEDAVAWFEGAAQSDKIKTELKKLAEAGKPPPDPKPVNDVPFIALEEVATYRWVELGPGMVKDLLVDREGKPSPLSDTLAGARAKGIVTIDRGAFTGLHAYWSRPCLNVNLSEGERQKKGSDYFVLVRNARPGNEITESHLLEFDPTVDSQRMRPAVASTLNEEGANRMRELTRANSPSNGHERHLAIIIQGEILSAPSILSAVGDRFQITGEFTQEYVNEVVSKVRTAGQ